MTIKKKKKKKFRKQFVLREEAVKEVASQKLKDNSAATCFLLRHFLPFSFVKKKKLNFYVVCHISSIFFCCSCKVVRSREGDIGNLGAGADVYRPSPSLRLQHRRLCLVFILSSSSCRRLFSTLPAVSAGTPPQTRKRRRSRKITWRVERPVRREREGGDGGGGLREERERVGQCRDERDNRERERVGASPLCQKGHGAGLGRGQ